VPAVLDHGRMTKHFREAPYTLRRSSDLAISSFDPRDNSIEVCFTTGAGVMRRGSDGAYIEVLATGPQNVRLERLNAGAPLLNTHDNWRIENVLGSVVDGTARMVGGRGFARVKLSPAAGDADNVEKVKIGVIRNVSIGYVVHATTRTEAVAGALPTVTATDWEPYEISLVPIPADPGAQIRAFPTGDLRMPARIAEAPLAARAAAIGNAILARFDARAFPLTTGREFVGSDLVDLARAVLEGSGVTTRGMARSEIVDAALAQRSMSTSDFPSILSNVAGKVLRQAYEAAPSTWKPISRQVKVADFKTQTRVQLGEAPKLEAVNEKGEYKHGSVGESAETYRLASYGKIVGFTRQAIINDDRDALTRIPRAFGTSAANLESDLVWGIITANAAMADGVPLFHADHANLASVGAAVGVEGVSAGREAIAAQTGLDGETILALAAAYLIVPAAVATPAEQFVGAIVPTKSADVVPESLRRLQVISEPRLDKVSKKAWFLAASPEQIDIIEAATLEGQDGVYLETKTRFDSDVVEIKCRHDFAAKALDWRGLFKNSGE
jgi:phage head maturation protease